jgi:hypothetical protein
VTKKGYQPETNIVKNEKGDLVAEFHSILLAWKNHFSQLLNVHGVNHVWQTNTTAEPLVPQPSAFDVEMAIEKQRKHKSPGTDQIPAKLIKAGGRTLHSKTHKLINSIWNKDQLPQQWKESITVPVYKNSNEAHCSNCRDVWHQLHTQTFIQHPSV